MSGRRWAIESAPGTLIASHPVFDTLEKAVAQVSSPYLSSVVPAPRLLVCDNYFAGNRASQWRAHDLEHDQAATELVELYDERIALAHRNAQAERLTGDMLNEVLAKGAELDVACEVFRRRFYPRKHHVIVGLRAVMACSRTRRSVTTVYDSGLIEVPA